MLSRYVRDTAFSNPPDRDGTSDDGRHPQSQADVLCHVKYRIPRLSDLPTTLWRAVGSELKLFRIYGLSCGLT